jgi:IMP cyclohydrolase
MEDFTCGCGAGLQSLVRKEYYDMNVYEVGSLAEKLSTNVYPGRGIVLGVTPDGTKSVAAYFIMGRSVNSRNRVFVQEPDGIRTEAHDPSLMKDPHLIIYHPVREAGCGLIVTNGDQTDTIWEFLAKGESWEAALRTRMFEDDGPNWTPRISGLLAGDGSYKMSILKSADAEGSACARFFYEYPAIAGLGHFIHTYVCDGNPVIPTFQGEPERVAMDNDMDAFAEMLWKNLNEDNKISLFVRYTDLKTGAYEQKIFNKHN